MRDPRTCLKEKKKMEVHADMETDEKRGWIMISRFNMEKLL